MLGPYTKAIVAFAVTFIGTLWANLEGRDDLGSLNFQEWLTVIVPTVLSVAAVYGFSNKPAPPA